MRLVIETYPRGGGYLALAVPEGHPLTEAGVCGDEFERRAIIGAVHSYFNRQERPVAVTVHPADEWVPRNDHPVVDRPEEALPYASGKWLIYADQTSIEQALEAAIAHRGESAADDGAPDAPKFRITYIDQGGAKTTRIIIPNKVERRGRESGFPETYLIAYDTAKDEPRTFRVDRIERLEAF